MKEKKSSRAVLVSLIIVLAGCSNPSGGYDVSVSSDRSSILLIPQGKMPEAGWPAVLLLHDHGSRFEKGWAKVIGANPEPYYNGMSIGDSLAAHGYVVFCRDALYWGSRRSELTQREFSDSLGETGEWYARVLADDKAGVDYLRSLACVDTSRIAVAGFSYGAYRAWNLASEDKRIKACVAAHWMTTLYQNRYNESWLCMVRKGIFPAYKDEVGKGGWKEFSEVAAEIVPRAFLLQYGLYDKLFPVSGVDSCVQVIGTCYETKGKPAKGGCFVAEAYESAHEMTHKHLQNWLIFLQNKL